MTLEEKRSRIRTHCLGVGKPCVDCPVLPFARSGEKCFSDGANIERNYNLLFATEADNVNHPAHYESGKFECIDVMTEAIGLEDTKGFCLCNAFKYIYRCTKKHCTPIEDVKKAIWYLNKFLELAGENDD